MEALRRSLGQAPAAPRRAETHKAPAKPPGRRPAAPKKKRA